MAILEECVKDLLHQGIIQHSDSPYSNPIVLVTKKNGSIRPCLDCRTLNEKIHPVAVNLRPVNDILASIPPGSKYFLTFDLTSLTSNCLWQRKIGSFLPLIQGEERWNTIEQLWDAKAHLGVITLK